MVKIFFNISIVVCASIISAFLAFLIQIFISNKLSLNDYGLFVYTYTLISIFLPFICFGLPQLWLKTYGEVGENSKKYFANSIKNIFYVFILIVIFFFGWSNINQFNSTENSLLAILTIVLVSQVFFELNSAVYQIGQNFKKLAFFQFTQNLSRFLFLILFYLLIKKLTVYTVVYSYFFSALIIIIIGIFELKKFFREIKIEKSEKIKFKFSDSIIIAFSNFLGMFIYSVNIVLLDFISVKENIALFNIALSIFYLFLIIPNTIYQKMFLTNFHKWSNHDKSMLKKNFIYGSLVMFLAGCLCTLFVNFFSNRIIIFFFSEKFYLSINLLNMLSFALPLIFCNYVAGTILLTKNFIIKKITNAAIVTILTPVFSYYLFLHYGLVGISFSIVLSSLFLLILNLISLKKNYVFN